MLRTPLVLFLLCVVGATAVIGLIVSPAAATDPTGSASSSALLADEIRELRADIAALRADIKELRAELGRGEPPEKSPVIDFTAVPRAGAGAGSRGDIAGRVRGVPNVGQYKIVIYAHTDVWYVQPLLSDPLTRIAADGTWSTWTHLGYRYAALLVRPSFSPPSTCRSLPELGGDVLAMAEVAASE